MPSDEKVIIHDSGPEPEMPSGAQDEHVPGVVVNYTSDAPEPTAKEYRELGYVLPRKADGSEYADDEVPQGTIASDAHAEAGTTLRPDGSAFPVEVIGEDSLLPAEPSTVVEPPPAEGDAAKTEKPDAPKAKQPSAKE